MSYLRKTAPQNYHYHQQLPFIATPWLTPCNALPGYLHPTPAVVQYSFGICPQLGDPTNHQPPGAVKVKVDGFNAPNSGPNTVENIVKNHCFRQLFDGFEGES